MVPATRSGRFGEYNYRCACIAQLVEQLTLKQRNVADSRGRPWTNLQLTPISWKALPPIDTDVSAAAQDCAAMLASSAAFWSGDLTCYGQFEFCCPSHRLHPDGPALKPDRRHCQSPQTLIEGPAGR